MMKNMHFVTQTLHVLKFLKEPSVAANSKSNDNNPQKRAHQQTFNIMLLIFETRLVYNLI